MGGDEDFNSIGGIMKSEIPEKEGAELVTLSEKEKLVQV